MPPTQALESKLSVPSRELKNKQTNPPQKYTFFFFNPLSGKQSGCFRLKYFLYKTHTTQRIAFQSQLPYFFCESFTVALRRCRSSPVRNREPFPNSQLLTEKLFLKPGQAFCCTPERTAALQTPTGDSGARREPGRAGGQASLRLPFCHC